MKRLLQAYQCTDPATARRGLFDWFDTPLGHALMASEQEVVRQALSGLFGYHLLQLGSVGGMSLEASRIPHRMVMLEPGDKLAPEIEGVEHLHGDGERLPVASDSIDALLLPHRLEYAPEPHQLLREVERVLIPEGHLLITGFNPLSAFGLRRLLQGWRDDVPWSGHFYTPMRIRDWLSLLGFDTVRLQHYFYRPPLQHQPMLQRLERTEEWGGRFCSPLGAGYMLLAKKRVATITPIRPRWRNARRLVTVGLSTGTSASREER